MKKGLDRYELKIDETNSFVDYIALVENPAIETDFLAFAKAQELIQFSLNDEKMELIGAAMIPEMNIYRKDKNGYEYEVFFSKDTIRQIAQIFFKKGLQANLNIEHTTVDADAYTFQSMIVDKEMGIAPLGLPDGSWVVGVKVNSPALWADIKEGKRKGFSVQGLFDLIKVDFTKQEDDMTEILDLLNKINNKIKNK